jgi:tRNA U34 5-methylaminomethyl-2-thiouridine-forming methyltransferase MnmC
MEFVLTKDGSYTIFNNELEENQHSLSAGAITEAQEKHVFPLEIQNGMHILDFCFGLGYNSVVTTFYYSDMNIIGLENDRNILEKIKSLPVPAVWEEAFLPYRNISEKRNVKDSKNNEIRIVLDDALKAMYELAENSFDRIFFDPFSPKKQPEMWTEEVFRQMFRLLKYTGKLSTYSCASQIRKNMIKAGFQITDGPSVGRKAPATIAIKNYQIRK